MVSSYLRYQLARQHMVQLQEVSVRGTNLYDGCPTKSPDHTEPCPPLSVYFRWVGLAPLGPPDPGSHAGRLSNCGIYIALAQADKADKAGDLCSVIAMTMHLCMPISSASLSLYVPDQCRMVRV